MSPVPLGVETPATCAPRVVQSLPLPPASWRVKPPAPSKPVTGSEKVTTTLVLRSTWFAPSGGSMAVT